MNTRILMFSKQASLYRSSAAAQLHYTARGIVQDMKAGGEYLKLGTIKGKTEQGYLKNLTTTSASKASMNSTQRPIPISWTEEFNAYATMVSALSTVTIAGISMLYTYITRQQDIERRKVAKDKVMIKESRARLRAAFSMSRNDDLLDHNKLIDILDRMRKVDSDCLGCTDNVDTNGEPKAWTDAKHNKLLKKWVEDSTFKNLKNNKDMEPFRDFLLTLHEGARTFKNMKERADEAGIDIEDIWGPFLNGSQEGKILQKVVLKFYTFYSPDEKEGANYSRIVGDKALWDDALLSRRRLVCTYIGGGGYGNTEIAHSSAGEENWKVMLDFLKEIDSRFDNTKNRDLKYLGGPKHGEGSGYKISSVVKAAKVPLIDEIA